jgi:hypothetical protein
MRLIPLVVLAALVAGCAGTPPRRSARSAELPMAFAPKPTSL